jgi:hypothetical protein
VAVNDGSLHNPAVPVSPGVTADDPDPNGKPPNPAGHRTRAARCVRLGDGRRGACAGDLVFGSAVVGEGWPMDEFVDWFPFAIVGATLTVVGSLKLYGILRGIEGGRDKPPFQYLCGT